MRRLLADRDARFYLGGQTLSTIGDNALLLAMGIWVKMLTGSSAAAGLVMFALTAGFLLAPVTGLVADRLRRRPLLIAANLAAAALVCALLAVHGPGQVWLIYPVMFGYGALGGLITSAQTALLAVMLPADLLGEANSVLQSTPTALLGRVDAAITVAINVPQTISIALGAALVAVVDYRFLLAAMALVIVLAAAYLAGEPDSGKAPVLVPERADKEAQAARE
jgi:MFS family permease